MQANDPGLSIIISPYEEIDPKSRYSCCGSFCSLLEKIPTMFIDDDSCKDLSSSHSLHNESVTSNSSSTPSVKKRTCGKSLLYTILFVIFTILLLSLIMAPSIKASVIFFLHKYTHDLRQFVHNNPYSSNITFWTFQFISTFILPSKGFPSIVIAYIQKDFTMSMYINITS